LVVWRPAGAILTSIEDSSEELEMQVYHAGAFQAKDGHTQIDNGLSYFHLFSEQKWFPLAWRDHQPQS
jgi:hypothetical protein